MQQAFRLIESWCREVELSVNPNKTNLVLFSRTRKRDGLSAPFFFGEAIPLVSQVKHLGVIIDSELKWQARMKNRAEKATFAFSALKGSVGSSRGLLPKVINWM